MTSYEQKPAPLWVSPVSENATALFQWDVTAWLPDGGAIVGLPTATVTNAMNATDPTVQTVSVSGNIIGVWVSHPGWQPGTKYVVSVHVVASDGREDDFSLQFWCGQHG